MTEVESTATEDVGNSGTADVSSCAMRVTMVTEDGAMAVVVYASLEELAAEEDVAGIIEVKTDDSSTILEIDVLSITDVVDCSSDDVISAKVLCREEEDCVSEDSKVVN